MSLLAGAKANGHDPQTWPSDVLARLPTTRDRDIDGPLPQRWTPAARSQPRGTGKVWSPDGTDTPSAAASNSLIPSAIDRTPWQGVHRTPSRYPTSRLDVQHTKWNGPGVLQASCRERRLPHGP